MPRRPRRRPRRPTIPTRSAATSARRPTSPITCTRRPCCCSSRAGSGAASRRSRRCSRASRTCCSRAARSGSARRSPRCTRVPRARSTPISAFRPNSRAARCCRSAGRSEVRPPAAALGGRVPALGAIPTERSLTPLEQRQPALELLEPLPRASIELGRDPLQRPTGRAREVARGRRRLPPATSNSPPIPGSARSFDREREAALRIARASARGRVVWRLQSMHRTQSDSSAKPSSSYQYFCSSAKNRNGR